VGRGNVGGGLDLGFLLGCLHSWISKGSGGGENERDNKYRDSGRERKKEHRTKGSGGMRSGHWDAW